ncbi:trehalose-6-phosphate synthase [Candidatus Methylomirabilis sp.]|uniref:alpha,alpha-trehalose-phosphate synthase (UDP-forming) n=1 Tax=Candidatus Methylomirabilis sp. TaxID=2032687 RepID=UPI002A6476DB|nr:trehalose-6-phosphate synthase [Candidatus Methylomirabilis sp.]
MRVTLRLVLAIVTVVSVIVLAFTLLQVRQEKLRQMSDLERRTSLLAESLGETVEPLVGQGQSARLQRIVEKFGNRERLAGVAVYDTKGLPLAVTHTLAAHVATPPKHVIEAIAADHQIGDVITIGEKLMYVFVLPLHPEAQVAGALALFHDASYIQHRLREIWQYNFLRLLIQALLISLTTLLVVRLTLIGPIVRVAEWIKRLRKGELIDASLLSGKGLLNPLVREVTHLAKSLSAAKAAAEDATLRQAGEALWTPRSLKDHLRLKLRGRSIFVISNREPYIHVNNGKQVECLVPASGLVTALEPVLAACEGTWIAHGSGDADSLVVDDADRLRVPPADPKYILKRVWLTKAEEKGYYYGFANEGLWPLCHIAHTRPVFRADDWRYYRDVNGKFAQVALAELEGVEEPCVLIQDYHFALLPRLIKERRPDARVGLFWHIPWPNPESFGICPWQRELLHGMLGADLIGFHIQFHCNNFLDTVDRALESRIEWEHFAVRRGNSTTYVKPFPISIAFPDDATAPGEGTVEPQGKDALLMEFGVRTTYLAVGVDRLDYTKGLLERLRGIERFLEKYPKFQGEFTFVELGAPSRTHIKQYQDLIAAIEAESDRINWRFQNSDWKPILLLKRHHTGQAIRRFYKAADACLVTSLHDGMNLVAKEFVAAREDEQGVLILSRFTGASRELRDALIVNPYDIEELADAVYAAVNMTKEEQTIRMRRMRDVVKEHNVYRWAADLMTELVQVRVEEAQVPVA